jgi:hypothetical protein
MKKIYILSFALLISMGLKAQLTLTKTNNAPIAGYSFSEKYYDSVTALPKTTGLNKSWNFIGMNLTSGSGSQSFSTAAASPSASSFPSANLSIASGTNSYSFYNSQTSSLDYLGDVDMNSGDKFSYSNTLVWMKWPFTYGNSNFDTFSGSNTSTSQPYSISGNMNISGSGTGTVTLPGGVTFTNCLQIVRTYTYNAVFPTYNYVQRVTAYEYWDGSYKNPILEVQYTSTVFGTLTAVGCSIRTNAAADVGIEENKLDEQKLIVFPNPVKDKLTIILPDNAIADEIELYDVSGKLILREANVNSLNTSMINQGVFLLVVKHMNMRRRKQVIIGE